MPRGQKSKLRAREKRRQNRAKTQGLESAQAAAGQEEEVVCSFASLLLEGPSSSVGVDTLQAPLSAPATTSAAAGVSCERSTGKAKGRVQISRHSTEASDSTQSSRENFLIQKGSLLVKYMLCQYKTKQPVRKADMLKIVHKWCRKDFPDILMRATEHLDLVYGLELKEVKPNSNIYTLVENSDDNSIGILKRNPRISLKGFLMPLLGEIVMNGNQASEEKIWECLNIMGLYDGKSHLIFGEPRKLITQDLVQEQYLVYQQVPDSDPPSYEFLWGPRAHAEIRKMEVLKFVAKLSCTTPTAFPLQYEEALKDEEERARAAPTAGMPSKVSGPSRATSSGLLHAEGR